MKSVISFMHTYEQEFSELMNLQSAAELFVLKENLNSNFVLLAETLTLTLTALHDPLQSAPQQMAKCRNLSERKTGVFGIHPNP